MTENNRHPEFYPRGSAGRARDLVSVSSIEVATLKALIRFAFVFLRVLCG
jgi:hypothetical protein